MATLTLSITSVADGTLSKTFTISEVNMAAWFTALKFFQGNPGATDAQAGLIWANKVMSEQVTLVQNYQGMQAAAAIQPITVT